MIFKLIKFLLGDMKDLKKIIDGFINIVPKERRDELFKIMVEKGTEGLAQGLKK